MVSVTRELDVRSLLQRSGWAEPGTEVTLLELVDAANDVCASERDVLSCVVHVLESGLVRLRGNFRGVPVQVVTGALTGEGALAA